MPPSLAGCWMFGQEFLQLKVMGISKDPSNSDASAANANWYVQWNEHIYFSSTGITGT